MKEQKTAEQLLSDTYKKHGWRYQPNIVGGCPHEHIALESMQSYSDQQNAELRERVKELEAKQSALTSAMHDALSELVQCNYMKANILLYNALETTDEL